MIDNLKATQKLLEEMEKHLPIPITMTPELMSSLVNKGLKLPKSYLYQIEEVYYWGDEGGIGCKLETPNEEPVYISLTHLRINKKHVLSKHIINYQRKRVRKLANQG